MTRFRITLVLVLLLGGAQAQSGYWWMGQDGSFGSANDNIEQVNIDKVNNRAAGYGYGPPAASNNQPTDLQEEASEISINNDIRESDTGYISPPFELPATECAIGWKCVSELFCDESATMVQTRVELSPEQKRRRGQLIPCMNQALGKFEVCCKKPPSFELSPPSASSAPAQNQIAPVAPVNNPPFKQVSQSPSISPPPSSQTTCPPVTSLPPISSCAGRQSNCWSVGVPDLDCLDDALCCFDGCANVCLGRGPIAGNPGPQSNPRLPATINEIILPPPSSSSSSSPSSSQPLSPQVSVNPEPIQKQQPDFGQTSSNSEPAFQGGYGGDYDDNSSNQYSDNLPMNIPSGSKPEKQKLAPSPTNIFGASSYPTAPQPSSSSPSSFPIASPPSSFPITSPPSSPQISPQQSTTATPFIQCPSAMKCVPKVNCDFNGVMVNFIVRLNSIQEQQ